MDSIWRFLPDFPAALRRFPVSILMLLVATGLLIAFSTMFGNLMMRRGPEPPLALYVSVFVLSAIFWSLAVELYGEARDWPRGTCVVLAIIGALAPVGLHFLPDIAPVFSAHWLPSFPPVIAAGAACLALAATAANRQGREANTRIIVTILGAAAGLLIAYIAVKVIRIPLEGRGFGSRLPPLGLGWTVIGGLALLIGWLASGSPPAEAAAAGDSKASLSMKIEQKLLPILVPVLFVLLVVMAAGFARPLLSNGYFPTRYGMPQVVPPAAALLLALTVVYLYLSPLRETGGRLATGFAKAWPWLAAVFIALVAIAIFFEIRGATNGMDARPISLMHPLGGQKIVPTVSRWLLGAFAILMAVIAMVWPARRDLRLLLVTLGIGLLLFGIGPLSAARLTSWRLANQLEQVVTERGFKTGGIIRPVAEAKWSGSDANLIRRINEGLTVFRSQGVLAPLFSGTPDTPFGGPPQKQAKLGESILARLGAKRQQNRPAAVDRNTRFYMNASNQLPIALPSGGHDIMVPVSFSTSAQRQKDVAINIGAEKPKAPVNSKAIDLRASVSEAGELTVRFKAADAIAKFDLRPLLKSLIDHEKKKREIVRRNAEIIQGKAKPGSTQEPVPGPFNEPQSIASAPGGITANLIVMRLSGDETDGKVRIRRASAWLLVNRADIGKKP